MLLKMIMMTKIHNRSIIFATVELKFTCVAIVLSWFWPERASIIWLWSFGIKLPCVNPTSLRADSQWIIILKTFELVTLSFSQFHAQRNWLLTHALHIFNQYMRLLCCFWSLMWLRKIENCFFRRICMESSEHNWANISETICAERLVFGK